MNRDDRACLALGREVVRQIRDLEAAKSNDPRPGYTRKTITYPGGSCILMVCSCDEVGDVFEAAAAVFYNGAETKTPASEVN